MALTSPGVEVTVIDQSQYLPAPTGSVPFVLVASAQNKANPNGTGVAQGTTAANASKLYQVTSQRDLVTLYGNPFFYTTTNGTPIQGYELNEYGLLAAYSLLGVTNRCYVLRADIDLASLVGQTGRPTGDPENGDYWLDSTTSTWGIYEFNATTGQFTLQNPIVITNSSDLTAGVPNASIGNIGDYAVNALQITSSYTAAGTYFYKTTSNVWVRLGANSAWRGDWPTVQGSISNPTLTAGETFTINLDGDVTVTITVPDEGGGIGSVEGVATEINSLGFSYLISSVRSGKLCIFERYPEDPTQARYLTLASSSGVLDDIGITAGTYYQPTVFFGTSSEQPLWQQGQNTPRPTGSVWVKVGAAGTGLKPVLSQWNSTTQSWISKNIVLSESDWDVIATLDPTGGSAIPAGTIYGQYQFNGTTANAPIYFWERLATGPTVITGTNINPDFSTLGPVGSGPYPLHVQVSSPGSSSLSASYTVSITEGSDATDFVTAWASAGIPYTSASVTTDGSIQLVHTEGGIIVINDVYTSGAALGKSSGALTEAGFVINTTDGCKYGTAITVAFDDVPQLSTSGSGTNLQVDVSIVNGTYIINPNTGPTGGSGYAVGDTVTLSGANLGGTAPANNLVVRVAQISGGGPTGPAVACQFVSGNPAINYNVEMSNWVEFTYTANEGAPVAEPANNTNWFYSVIDEVDVMVNYNGAWRGYKNQNYDNNGFPTPSGSNQTDPNGPIISPTEPIEQSDGTALVTGDLWINTTNLEDYPVINRWQIVDGVAQWVLIDNTDQVNPTGVVFADARWATNGTTSPTDDPIPTIKSLLTSNYLDLDAPSSSLYPTGMLLFNTRRSGYNVKQFKVNYFSNANFPGESLPAETNAWVSASGLQSNGAPFMGRKAQRAMVVEAMRSSIDTNQALRDEDNFFNLMAAPNYPELQPNMVVLNNDRGQTGYILGDTPLGLPDNATDIQAWATNAAGAQSTGEEGCVTRDTYLGLFYPSGIATDLSGNEVAVPASHMMLRTFLRNDTLSYPWLAAAGTRRGIIDNALNIGYVNRQTGEFVAIKTSLGIRDTLYVNFINPLVFFTGNGLLNYGNKTSFNSQSALDRTNVARLVAYIRRQLTLAARPFVFEPNDAFTRSQISGVVESLMLDLQSKRGIYDYLVVCDDSNNTPARIDRNELWVDVAIEPVKAIEFIYIPVRILNTGEVASL